MTLLEIYRRQGLPLPTSDNDWKLYRERKEARKVENVKNAAHCLQTNGVKYTRMTYTYFVIVTDPHGVNGNPAVWIDFYPAVGRWEYREQGKGKMHEGHGVRSLVAFLKGSE